jgi:hypothetical protein
LFVNAKVSTKISTCFSFRHHRYICNKVLLHLLNNKRRPNTIIKNTIIDKNKNNKYNNNKLSLLYFLCVLCFWQFLIFLSIIWHYIFNDLLAYAYWNIFPKKTRGLLQYTVITYNQRAQFVSAFVISYTFILFK